MVRKLNCVWWQQSKKLCPEKINLLEIIGFLVRTVAWRVQNIGSNINSQLKNKANDSEWFSLALDELTDVLDTTLWLFLWGINAKFEVAEKLASVISL